MSAATGPRGEGEGAPDNVEHVLGPDSLGRQRDTQQDAPRPGRAPSPPRVHTRLLFRSGKSYMQLSAAVYWVMRRSLVLFCWCRLGPVLYKQGGKQSLVATVALSRSPAAAAAAAAVWLSRGFSLPVFTFAGYFACTY